MADQPIQEDKNVRQEDSILSITWVRWALTLSAGAVILFVGGLLIWYLSPILNAETNLSLTQRKDVVQGLASVMQAVAVLVAGVVGLAGLYFTRQTLLHNQETLSSNQKDSQRTLELTEQGQITERFTRAIDQLGETHEDGKSRLETRLGGIYALERIARDSMRDYGPVIEVLTAYVREHARRQTQAKSSIEDTPENNFALSPDIQAILTVLGRRTHSSTDGKGESINLRGTNLRRAQLRGANLARADLTGADFAGANLRGTNFGGCSLEQANFTGADLVRSNLNGADLTGADLTGATLSGANLEQATLTDADLTGAYLTYAKIAGAELTRADLGSADLWEAHGLRPEQIEQAYGGRDTRLPSSLTAPASWSKAR